MTLCSATYDTSNKSSVNNYTLDEGGRGLYMKLSVRHTNRAFMEDSRKENLHTVRKLFSEFAICHVEDTEGTKVLWTNEHSLLVSCKTLCGTCSQYNMMEVVSWCWEKILYEGWLELKWRWMELNKKSYPGRKSVRGFKIWSLRFTF